MSQDPIIGRRSLGDWWARSVTSGRALYSCQAVDAIITGRYQTTEPDSPIELFTGEIRLVWDGVDTIGAGRATYRWYPGPGVHVEVDLEVDLATPDISDTFTA